MDATPGKPNVEHSIAGQAETGRPCPYCRFPLKEGVPIASCGVCRAAHHADCWQDNGGCAVIACAGGPATASDRAAGVAAGAVAAQPTAALQPGVQPVVAAGAPGWPPPGPAPGQRRGPSLSVAVIVLAVAIVGAAAAVALSRNSGTNQTPNLVPAAATTSSTAEADAAGGGEASHVETVNETTSSAASDNGLLPAVSNEEMAQEIQPMLLDFHEDVVSYNNRAAWELLSHRKQVQDQREYGYPLWARNQDTLSPYLKPEGLQVVVEQAEPSTGVARVDVTGMAWDKPGAPCSEWSGITWVKYENGAWKYDPGYSTTPQREREWKPRYSELLGGRC